MAELDRLVTYTREETRLVTPDPRPSFVRTYLPRAEAGADDGITSGVISAWLNGSALALNRWGTADEIYVSVNDNTGTALPTQNWPSNHITIQDGANGWRYTITAAEHPEFRDRFNRRSIARNTWRLTVRTADTEQIGTGLTTSASTVQTTFSYIAGDPVEVTGDVEYRLWCSKRSPTPTDQITIHGAVAIQFGQTAGIEIPVSVAFFKFRTGAGFVVPSYLDTFREVETGDRWTVRGRAESDQRGQFVNLYCDIPGGET